MTPKVPDKYKEEKRAELLKHALACFADQGYQATTIDDIVRRAGVSKGMIYNYFPSKEEIYLQLLEEQTEKSFEDIEAAFRVAISATRKLQALMKRFREMPLNLERQRAMAVHLEFLLYCTRHEELKQVMLTRYDRFVGFIMTLMDEGKANGEFPADLDTHTFASVFWAFRDGLCLHFTNLSNETKYEQVCGMFEDMMWQYLKGGDTAR